MSFAGESNRSSPGVGPSQGPYPGQPGPCPDGPGFGGVGHAANFPGRGAGFNQGVRGGRGNFMGPSTPPLSRGVGRAWRGAPGGVGDNGWTRGGMRGQGRRGRGRHYQEDQNWNGRDAMMEEEWTGEPDLPYVTEEVLNAVARESETRTINIDGVGREIRVYGETAVVLMDWNDPRVMSFGEGCCKIVFDGGQFELPMRIGQGYEEFTIDGETHRVKLGVPSQELILDGRGYQCFFGGKPITVHLAGKDRTVRLDGKPPSVVISPVKNTEFCVGKIQLVINGTKLVHLYLDAKRQRVHIDGKPFVLKFVDAFRAVTINGVKFPVEFGGLPLSISVRGYRCFLRFTSLPPGIIPGQVNIRGMEHEGQNITNLPGSPAPERFTDPGIQGNRGSPSVEKPHVYSGDTGVPHQQVGMPVASEGVFMPHQGPGPQGPSPRGPVPQGPSPLAPVPQGPLPIGQVAQGPSPGVPMPPGLPPRLQAPPPPGPALQRTLFSGPPLHAPPQQSSLPPTGPPLPQVSVPLGPLPPPPQPALTTMPPPIVMMPMTSMSSQMPPQPPIATAPPITLANMSVPPPNTTPGSYMTNQLPLPMMNPPQTSAPPPVPIDLNSLFENLTRSGLIGTKPTENTKNKTEGPEKKKEEEQEEKEKEKDELIPFAQMFESEHLRK